MPVQFKTFVFVLEYPEWKNVVMEEMKALEKNNTWEICALPKDTSLWDANGCSLSNTKQMRYLINIRQVLLSVAIHKDWSLYQLDVKNVFLNGDLVEEAYTSPRLTLKPSLVSRFINFRYPYMV
ncbi:reverse transcriptase [Cucumis melo var. makuwa]|uniref:Reverse transcriptase n=1 Tax=Cucumis melo var. makuwa TaxID=1194695 RepID=A0A5A7TKB9_CUCMM|nr:reverse transcriptase [Cucumis melo var. makuwa]TYK05408.1 reverse transcriptase [Cucumis melo var. makuwa]